MAAEVYNWETTLNLRPVGGALEAIQELRKLCRIVILTARIGDKLDAANIWLVRHMQTRDLECIGIQTNETSKAMVGINKGVKLLVDDDERHIYKVVHSGMEGILFKNSAPCDFYRENIKICRSWKEVTSFIKTFMNLPN
jgi:hypothetical protein